MFSAEDMAKRPASWLDGSGDKSEIVMSSRVRIARNLNQHRFTHHCGNEELSGILRETWSAARETRGFAKHSFIPMGEISTLDRQFLAERHLVSREFLMNSSNRGLVINSDENVCLMINEEDHMRIQGFASGFDVEKAYQRAGDLAGELAPRLDMAFSERYGFLTACPTNLGTGLRVSVLIHLPGLVHSKEISKLLESLRKLNHSIRGLHGEGTEVMGNFFQLSNSATLGSSEEAIRKGLRDMVAKVISFEEKARDMLFRKARSLLEDKVWRAYGLLRYARAVSTKEALSLISAVRMGVGMGVIDDISIRALNELLIYSQPAHLPELGGTTMDSPERDVARAEHIRNALTRSSK
jgi:protein arginine kinase